MATGGVSGSPIAMKGASIRSRRCRGPVSVVGAIPRLIDDVNGEYERETHKVQ